MPTPTSTELLVSQSPSQPEEILPSSSPRVQITYYTDPLCSWSWGLEPQWRRLRYEFGSQIGWRYAMGGLLPDWQKFSDPINDISRPGQMAPQWIQIRQLVGMPTDEGIWREDPPASSYPACIAVKAAERQGSLAAEAYLRRLREAVMLERLNIARREILLDLAAEVSEMAPTLSFNPQQFQADLDHPASLEAFREDVKESRYLGISRFPALVFRGGSGKALLIVGYRPYPVLKDAIATLSPNTYPLQEATDPVAYARYWGRITATEVAVALNLPLDETQHRLAAAVAAGKLQQNGFFYQGS
ncbi:MAG TPA: DsbA family protein [Leptolyngbyaceae cyanobacterium]